MFSTNIGKLLVLFSFGATIEATPSTNDNSYAISDNTIGWPICHLSISKKSLTVATHLSNTSFLLNPVFVNIANLNIKSDIFCSEFLKKRTVASTPGIYFGKNWDNHIRISLAAKRKIFSKGVNLFEKFCKSKHKK